MPLFPFRVNIFKLQEQDVMKKFTACTFPQDIIASSRWSAIHAQIHTCTDTSRIDRGTTDWLRCSPKHVRSLVWKRKKKKRKIKKNKKEEWINQPASRKGKADSAVLSMHCRGHMVHTMGQLKIKIQPVQAGPLAEKKQFSHVSDYLDFQGPTISPCFFGTKDAEDKYHSFPRLPVGL